MTDEEFRAALVRMGMAFHSAASRHCDTWICQETGFSTAIMRPEFLNPYRKRCALESVRACLARNRAASPP